MATGDPPLACWIDYPWFIHPRFSPPQPQPTYTTGTLTITPYSLSDDDVERIAKRVAELIRPLPLPPIDPDADRKAEQALSKHAANRKRRKLK